VPDTQRYAPPLLLLATTPVPAVPAFCDTAVLFDPEVYVGSELEVPLLKNDQPWAALAIDDVGPVVIPSKFCVYDVPVTLTAVAWARASVAAVATARANTAAKAMRGIPETAMSGSREAAAVCSRRPQKQRIACRER
jgi:hypothetical protein